jgi:hypothetical protein
MASMVVLSQRDRPCQRRVITKAARASCRECRVAGLRRRPDAWPTRTTERESEDAAAGGTTAGRCLLRKRLSGPDSFDDVQSAWV